MQWLQRQAKNCEFEKFGYCRGKQHLLFLNEAGCTGVFWLKLTQVCWELQFKITTAETGLIALGILLKMPGKPVFEAAGSKKCGKFTTLAKKITFFEKKCLIALPLVLYG